MLASSMGAWSQRGCNGRGTDLASAPRRLFCLRDAVLLGPGLHIRSPLDSCCPSVHTSFLPLILRSPLSVFIHPSSQLTVESFCGTRGHREESNGIDITMPVTSQKRQWAKPPSYFLSLLSILLLFLLRFLFHHQ